MASIPSAAFQASHINKAMKKQSRQRHESANSQAEETPPATPPLKPKVMTESFGYETPSPPSSPSLMPRFPRHPLYLKDDTEQRIQEVMTGSVPTPLLQEKMASSSAPNSPRLRSRSDNERSDEGSMPNLTLWQRARFFKKPQAVNTEGGKTLAQDKEAKSGSNPDLAGQNDGKTMFSGLTGNIMSSLYKKTPWLWERSNSQPDVRIVVVHLNGEQFLLAVPVPALSTTLSMELN